MPITCTYKKELNKQLASSNLNTNENYPATSKSYMNTYSTEQ